jgi:site-specific recombinase XerD
MVLAAADQAKGRAGVGLLDARERKYSRVSSAWTWFCVFRQVWRVNLDERRATVWMRSVSRRAIKRSIHQAGILEPAMPRRLRLAFATQLL